MSRISVVGDATPAERTLNIISDAPSVHLNRRESRKFRKGIEPHMKGSSTLRTRQIRERISGVESASCQVPRQRTPRRGWRLRKPSVSYFPVSHGAPRAQYSRVRTPRSLFRCCRNAGKPSTRTSRQPYRRKSFEKAPTANGTEPIARCAAQEHVLQVRTSWTQKSRLRGRIRRDERRGRCTIERAERQGPLTLVDAVEIHRSAHKPERRTGHAAPWPLRP